MGIFDSLWGKNSSVEDKRAMCWDLFEEGMSVAEVSHQTGISAAMVSNFKRGFDRSRNPVGGKTQGTEEKKVRESSEITSAKQELELKKIQVEIEKYKAELAEQTDVVQKAVKKTKLEGEIQMLQFEKMQLERTVEENKRRLEDTENEIIEAKEELDELEETLERMGKLRDGDEEDSVWAPLVQGFMQSLQGKLAGAVSVPSAPQTVVTPEPNAEIVPKPPELTVDEQAQVLLNQTTTEEKKQLLAIGRAKSKAFAKTRGIPGPVFDAAWKKLQEETQQKLTRQID